jgi:hypothetical protein
VSVTKSSKRADRMESVRNSINWAAIDARIAEGTASTSILAAENDINATDMRTLLTDHYGQRIEFKRGRNGGIKWSGQ